MSATSPLLMGLLLVCGPAFAQSDALPAEAPPEDTGSQDAVAAYFSPPAANPGLQAAARPPQSVAPARPPAAAPAPATQSSGAPAQAPAPETEAAGPAADKDAAAEPAPAPAPRKSRRKVRRRAPRASPAAGLIEEGVVNLGRGQLNTAVAILERATRMDTASAEAFAHLGGAYYRRAFQKGAADREDAQAAVDAYQTAAALDPDFKTVKDPYPVFHGLAMCLEALERYEEALSALKRAMSVAPANPMPALYAARLRYRLRGFDLAAQNLQLAARRARKLGAYRSFSRLVKTEPLFAALLSDPRGRAILEAYDAVEVGTLGEAEAERRIKGWQEYRDSVSEQPTARLRGRARADPGFGADPAVLKLLERGAHAFSAADWDEAIGAYETALDRDRTKGTLDAVQVSLALERIGTSYRRLGLAVEGARVLEKAVSEMPENASARYQLALCYSTAGKLGDALTALNRALDTAPTTPELRTTLLLAKTDGELEPLRGLPRFKEILRSHGGRLQARK